MRASLCAFVGAKSAALRFCLTAKTADASLPLLSPRKPLCWVCVGAPGPCPLLADHSTLAPRAAFSAMHMSRQKMIFSLFAACGRRTLRGFFNNLKSGGMAVAMPPLCADGAEITSGRWPASRPPRCRRRGDHTRPSGSSGGRPDRTGPARPRTPGRWDASGPGSRPRRRPGRR